MVTDNYQRKQVCKYLKRPLVEVQTLLKKNHFFVHCAAHVPQPQHHFVPSTAIYIQTAAVFSEFTIKRQLLSQQSHNAPALIFENEITFLNNTPPFRLLKKQMSQPRIVSILQAYIIHQTKSTS